MLYTSCYGRSRWFPKDALQVQTSRSAPAWWQPTNRILIAELVPQSVVFAMAKSGTGDWRAAYRKQLEELHEAGTLAALIAQITEGAVLLCHESDHHYCHRKVLADYLNELGLAKVSELERPGSTGTKRADPQMSLF